jgi:GAF domain-containing protein
MHPTQNWLDLLTRTAVALDTSLEYETTLRRVARLIVGSVADICTFALVGTDVTHLQSTITACSNPDQERLLARIATRWMGSSVPWLFEALSSSRALLKRRVSDAEILETAQSAGELQLIRALGPRSVMKIPLLSRGLTLGLVTLVFTTPGREYNTADLAVSEDLARQCALAIDAGRSFREARDAGESNEAEQALWRMENAIEGLNRIRRNLRGLARANRPQAPRAAGRRIDLVKVVHAAVRGYESEVRFGQNLDGDPPTRQLLVDADRRGLHQVLVTVLDSVSQVSLMGAVRLSAQADEQGVSLQLEDGPIRGAGRANRSAERCEGTPDAPACIPWNMGIAWYVCREILAHAGGVLSADTSSDGRGTTIQLWLPRARRQPVAPAPSAAP